MKSTSILRFVFWAALLVGGFFMGTAWKANFNQETAPQISADEGNPRNVGEPAPNKTTAMPPGLNESEKATIRLFENSAPSVAFITTSQLRQDYWTRNVMEIPQGSGSGFVWDKDGHVITNYHVIQDRKSVV